MVKKLILLMVVMLLLLGVVVGIGAAETVKIGMLTSLTGALAPFGPPIQHGADLAVEQINKAGGIMGRELVLVVRDSGTAPAIGRDAAAKLVEIDGVPALIGALSSGVTLAASSVTIPNQVVHISPASTSPAIADLKDNGFVFRTVVSDAFQGVVLAGLAVDLGYETVSVIYVNNAYGKGLALVFKANFEARGWEVPDMVPYEEGKPSYRSEMEQLIEGKFLFCDGMKGEAVAAGPASKFIEGSFGTAAGAMEIPVAAQFTADFDERFEPSTVPYNREAYDAAVLIALAMWRTGPVFFELSRGEQGVAIRDSLMAVANSPGEEVTYGELEKAFDLLTEGKEINYQGVSGPVEFDKNGDMSMGAMEIWVIKEGEIVTDRMIEVKIAG